MRERITVHTRDITPPTFDSVDFTETYNIGFDDWASVETPVSGISSFSGVTIPDRTTHIFVIRFDDSITSENVIRWEGESYDIIRTTDPDKRNQYLELFCKVLGDKDLEANK